MATQLENSAFKVKAAPVPDVSQILPEPGAFVVSDHDGQMYYADDYGWHKAGEPWSPVTLFHDYNGVDDVSIKLSSDVGSTITIHWGDGTTTDFSGSGVGVDIEVPHTYPEPGSYYCYLTGDLDVLDGIYLFVDYFVSQCNINGWKFLDNLQSINIGTSAAPGRAEGFIGSLDFLPILIGQIVMISCPNISGDASRFLSDITTNYQIINCPKISFDNVVLANASMLTMYLFGCDLSSVEIDRALLSAVSLSGKNVMLHLNAPRTKNSNSAISTLIANGCTVAVNEATELFESGPELYAIDNAVKMLTDVNSLAGWDFVGNAGTVFNTQGEKTGGNSDFGFIADLNANPTANGGITMSAGVATLVDDIIRVAFDWAHVGDGIRWSVFWNGSQFFCHIYDVNTELSRTAVYRVAGATELILAFRERLGFGNGGIYLDNLSIKKVQT